MAAALIGTATIAAETAGATFGVAYSESVIFEEPYIRPKNVIFKFDLPVLIISGFIFIIVISWFETMRIWMEHLFNPSKLTLLGSALEMSIYSLMITLVLTFLIILIIKFWINKHQN